MSFDHGDLFADEVADTVLRALDLGCRAEDLCPCGDGWFDTWWACRACSGEPVADHRLPASRCPACGRQALVCYVRTCRACGARERAC
jgi:hypothetical protein